jgi:acyl-CoA synthetase (AMP-forming)/AMP-acid ligase II
VQADDVAVVLHTSGTSGVPKRVELRHGVLAARTVVNGGLLDLGPGDVYVTAKGIHHVGGLGLTLVALGVGAGVIPLRRFDTAAWGALAALGPTHASFVPTMIEMLLGADGMTLPSLRIVQYGGAPIRAATLERLVREHPELGVVALYGQTEGSPIASLSPSDHRAAVADRPDLLETAGRAAPGVGLRIVYPDTGVEPSEPDGVGEIVARADHFALPGDDGWLRTGDLGRIDAEGYLRIVGRLGDVITRGGENVHPGEVEQVLAGHPGVADVAVAAVPDDRLGQTVGAWIVPRQPDAPPDPEALRAFARARLAGFKVPTVWTFRAALPRNPNGKVVRGRLTL